MKNVVRNFMILCIFIILGSAAINNRIRTSSDIEIKDVYAYTLDENEEHMSLDTENIDSDIENTDEGLNEEEIIEEEEPEKVIGKENEEIDIEGDLSNPLFNKDIDIIERIDNYLGDDKCRTSFIYYNLVNEETLSFNEDLYMDAASLYKLGLSLVAYNMVDNGEITLDDLVYYSPWQYQGGTGILQYDLSFGALPLRTLIEYSIKYSDNIAATMIYSYIGGWSNFKWMLFEILDIDYGDYDNITSARVELEILRYIYENRNNSNYATLIDYLKNTDFHDRLDKYLPQDIVAHKIGSNEGYTHDIGIVFTDEPYIIIMMTDNVYDGPDKIADISKAMYLYNIDNQKSIETTATHIMMEY